MNKPRLLVIGSRGFLGQHVVRCAMQQFQVVRGDVDTGTELGTLRMDVSDASSVRSAFAQASPDAVVLLAAISDIDACQSAPERAYAINTRGAENVAQACANARAKLIFTSTAAVYDGKKHGYTEDDPVSPLSVYGKTKARAEALVNSILPSALILRLALVLGFAGSDRTNALLDKLLSVWRSGRSLTFPTKESRNPIDAGTVAQTVMALLATPQLQGTFHVGATDSLSRYDLAKRLAARAGVSADLVQPQDEPADGRAPRGEDHFLLTDKIRRVCNIEMGTTDQVIERCFHETA